MAIYELKGHELSIISFIDDYTEERGKGAKLPPVADLEKLLDLNKGKWNSTVRKLVDRKILKKHGSGRYSVTDLRCYIPPKQDQVKEGKTYKPSARAMFRPKEIQGKEHLYWMNRALTDWVKDGILIFA